MLLPIKQFNYIFIISTHHVVKGLQTFQKLKWI
jgi:hypothetical protein